MLRCRVRLGRGYDQLMDYNFALSVNENPLSLQVEVHARHCWSPDTRRKVFRVAEMRFPSITQSGVPNPPLLPLESDISFFSLRREFLEARWLLQKLHQVQCQFNPVNEKRGRRVPRMLGPPSVSGDFEYDYGKPFAEKGYRVDLMELVEDRLPIVDASGKTYLPPIRPHQLTGMSGWGWINRKWIPEFPLSHSPYQRMPVIRLTPDVVAQLPEIVIERLENYTNRSILQLANSPLFLVEDGYRRMVWDPQRGWLDLSRTVAKRSRSYGTLSYHNQSRLELARPLIQRSHSDTKISSVFRPHLNLPVDLGHDEFRLVDGRNPNRPNLSHKRFEFEPIRRSSSAVDIDKNRIIVRLPSNHSSPPIRLPTRKSSASEKDAYPELSKSPHATTTQTHTPPQHKDITEFPLRRESLPSLESSQSHSYSSQPTRHGIPISICTPSDHESLASGESSLHSKDFPYFAAHSRLPPPVQLLRIKPAEQIQERQPPIHIRPVFPHLDQYESTCNFPITQSMYEGRHSDTSYPTFNNYDSSFCFTEDTQSDQINDNNQISSPLSTSASSPHSHSTNTYCSLLHDRDFEQNHDSSISTNTEPNSYPSTPPTQSGIPSERPSLISEFEYDLNLPPRLMSISLFSSTSDSVPLSQLDEKSILSTLSQRSSGFSVSLLSDRVQSIPPRSGRRLSSYRTTSSVFSNSDLDDESSLTDAISYRESTDKKPWKPLAKFSDENSCSSRRSLSNMSLVSGV